MARSVARAVLRSAEPHLPDGVRFTDLGDRLQLTATADLDGLATKWFAELAVYVPFDPDSWAVPGTRLLGYAFTQFAMPVRAELPGRFDFNPSPTLSSQPAVLPLLLQRPDGTVCLLAPLDSWHEQIVAVAQDDESITGLRWGWHGDLGQVEAGFTTTLGIYEGRSATELLRAWGSEIRAKADADSSTSTRRLGPGTDPTADPVVTHLSYWTDNGAAYWYRTDDYRYAADPALLWHWYLTVNRLAEALDLPAFKDCFFTATSPTPAIAGTSAVEAGRDEIDGDPHPEVEALLSALSAGVAGIGDRIGRTDVVIIERLCRPDGVLVKPDRPLALADQSLFGPPDYPDRLCWATTSSDRWHYVVALHTGPSTSSVRDSFPLAALRTGPEQTGSAFSSVSDEKALPVQPTWLVYDWRHQTAEPVAPTGAIEAELGWRGWGLWVCCPIETGPDGTGQALVGDPARYATMGADRVTHDDDGDGRPRVLLADGEEPVALRWWREDTGLFDR